jgi:hypothetical protein
MITNRPTSRYMDPYSHGSVQRGVMASRRVQAAAQHYYPTVMVDYGTMPRSQRIHQTNHHLYDSEYVHVPAPHHKSHAYILESNVEYEDVPAFHPGNGIAYADDIDVDNCDWEADAVHID